MASLVLNNDTAVRALTIQIEGVECEVSSLNSPLYSFTRRPSYTSEGEGPPICADHCEDLTRCLTRSPERCLSRENKDVPCPRSFATASPFSDLYFPDNIYEGLLSEMTTHMSSSCRRFGNVCRNDCNYRGKCSGRFTIDCDGCDNRVGCFFT